MPLVTQNKLSHEKIHLLTYKIKSMIYSVTMYSAKCDNCLEGFEAEHTGYCAFVDKESCRDEMVNHETGWIEQEVNGRNKHYCPECYIFDDNDKLMLNSDRKKEPKIYIRDDCMFNYCPSPDDCKAANKCLNG
jgi:hypothetical protein